MGKIKKKTIVVALHEQDDLEEVAKPDRKRLRSDEQLLENIEDARSTLTPSNVQDTHHLHHKINYALNQVKGGLNNKDVKWSAKFKNDVVFQLSQLAMYYSYLPDQRGAIKDPTPEFNRFVAAQSVKKIGKHLQVALKAVASLALLVFARDGKERAKKYLHNGIAEAKHHSHATRGLRLFKKELAKEKRKLNLHLRMARK